MEDISNLKSSSMLNLPEDNNDLFITGYYSVLANDDTRTARDFYLLLMVYVNYFCSPVFSFVLKGLSGFGKDIQTEFGKISNFVYIAIALFAENRECISVLAFSRKEQVERIFSQEALYRKTVLL